MYAITRGRRGALIRIGQVGATALMTVAAILFAVGVPASADVNSFTLKQPLNNATVRETIPIRLPRDTMNSASYATIVIDGQFRGAPAIPDTGDVIFLWNTKDPFQTPDKPGTDQVTADGPHAVVVHLFDRDSNEVAVATSNVRVANKITTLPDGVHLVYKWRPNEIEAYRYHSELGTPDTGTGSKNILQEVDAHFDRSVEDISGSEILLRDVVTKDGVLTTGTTGTSPSGAVAAGTQVALTTVYSPTSKYWTVNKFGQVLTDNRPIGSGNHFGFPIAEFPPRRVNVGDSWQDHIMVTLQWASEHPTFVRGTARIDSFEWQDGYPTAKIIETYDGPARFTIDLPNAASAGAGAPDMNTVDAVNVHMRRIVWFAYEAGMIVRSQTTMDADTRMSSGQYTALGITPTANDPNSAVAIVRQARGPLNRQAGGDPNMAGDDSMPTPGSPVLPVNPMAQGRTQDQRNAVPLVMTSRVALAGVGS